MALTDDLIAWYTCETAGAAFDDVHGSSDLTSKSGSPATTTGVVNLGITAGASDRWYSASTPLALRITGSYTINFWFRWNAAGTSSPYLMYQSGGQYIRLNYSTKILEWKTRGSGGVYHSLYSNLGITSQSTWYMLTFKYNAANKQKDIFINAIQRGSTIASHANSMYAASSYYYSWYLYSGWTGVFDERGVWSRFIGSDEISELWNSGNGLTYDDLSGAEATGALTIPEPGAAGSFERFWSAQGAASGPAATAAGAAIAKRIPTGTATGPTGCVDAVFERIEAPAVNRRYAFPQEQKPRYFDTTRRRRR